MSHHGRTRRLRSLALITLAGLLLIGSSHPPYDRKLYPHWDKLPGDCQTVRVKVLSRDGTHVQFQEPDECRVELGIWQDPFTGNFGTVPQFVHIDHMVPLKNAHESGAWAWTPERRREFANDLSYRYHLLAVTASANASKGDRGPDLWKPPSQDFWCQYAQTWASIKFVYGLGSTEAEREAIRDMLKTC